MAKEPITVELACEAYVKSLNEGRYYDAHEDLEALWFPRRFDDDDEVRLWKGFINAAVCFELIRKGRLESSKKVWGNYQKYIPLLGTFETKHHEMYVKMSQLVEEKHKEYTHV